MDETSANVTTKEGYQFVITAYSLQVKDEEITLEPGAYDANNVMLASWNELINSYGLDIQKDYTASSYNTDTSSPYYILNNNDSLNSVVKIIIDDSVTNIGQWSFCSCSDLTYIVIPDSVTSIGMCAFYDCSKLETINLPNHIVTIELETFANCKSLKEVMLPSTVTTISSSAFERMYNIKYYNYSQ